MKLSKLYSNQPTLFKPIEFTQGMNVILAEIRLPENKEKDTHNLGKTTLGSLLDFGLLSTKDLKFFLFKHIQLFKDFIFFLEIELEEGSYLTMRRSVESATKISFKKHTACYQDFSALSKWDHLDIPFDRAQIMLDSLLDLRALKPWSYRKCLGYLLRSQNDFRDVFRLDAFKGKASDWKPFLAHIFGFNDELIKQYYKKEDELKIKENETKIINRELGGSLEDISKIESILLIKREELGKKQAFLNGFDFGEEDKDKIEILVDKIDQEIAELNAESYSLKQSRQKILSAIKEDKILFNPDEAAKIFREANVFFEGQIKKDFEQLIAFNRAITDERSAYLQEEFLEVEARLKQVNAELLKLNTQRLDTLDFLSDTDVFNKYKQMSNELTFLRADIIELERQREFLHRLQALRSEVRELKNECRHIQAQIEENVEQQTSDSTSLFSSIQRFFNEIVKIVIDRNAILSVSVNSKGHLDFKAEILDGLGNTTSADLGHTYRKLLCIAFDMALLRAHLEEKFPRFVYHDGVFESLDSRKKEKLLAVMRGYANLGIQSVITLIDSDLPNEWGNKASVFDEGEIVLVLHDENEQGRLFKMGAW
ncbi:MAG: DUF2326 domain-containing protein [Gammaproteobacteria bacterium]|nr:DUF2326 domain-containing protein [Gammaproteobacteria bacterium]